MPVTQNRNTLRIGADNTHSSIQTARELKKLTTDCVTREDRLDSDLAHIQALLAQTTKTMMSGLRRLEQQSNKKQTDLTAEKCKAQNQLATARTEHDHKCANHIKPKHEAICVLETKISEHQADISSTRTELENLNKGLRENIVQIESLQADITVSTKTTQAAIEKRFSPVLVAANNVDSQLPRLVEGCNYLVFSAFDRLKDELQPDAASHRRNPQQQQQWRQDVETRIQLQRTALSRELALLVLDCAFNPASNEESNRKAIQSWCSKRLEPAIRSIGTDIRLLRGGPYAFHKGTILLLYCVIAMVTRQVVMLLHRLHMNRPQLTLAPGSLVSVDIPRPGNMTDAETYTVQLDMQAYIRFVNALIDNWIGAGLFRSGATTMAEMFRVAELCNPEMDLSRANSHLCPAVMSIETVQRDGVELGNLESAHVFVEMEDTFRCLTENVAIGPDKILNLCGQYADRSLSFVMRIVNILGRFQLFKNQPDVHCTSDNIIRLLREHDSRAYEQEAFSWRQQQSLNDGLRLSATLLFITSALALLYGIYRRVSITEQARQSLRPDARKMEAPLRKLMSACTRTQQSANAYETARLKINAASADGNSSDTGDMLPVSHIMQLVDSRSAPAGAAVSSHTLQDDMPLPSLGSSVRSQMDREIEHQLATDPRIRALEQASQGMKKKADENRNRLHETEKRLAKLIDEQVSLTEKVAAMRKNLTTTMQASQASVQEAETRITRISQQIEAERTVLLEQTQATHERMTEHTEEAHRQKTTLVNDLRQHRALILDANRLELIGKLLTPDAWDRLVQRHCELSADELKKRVTAGQFENPMGELICAPAPRASSYNCAIRLQLAICDAYLELQRILPASKHLAHTAEHTFTVRHDRVIGIAAERGIHDEILTSPCSASQASAKRTDAGWRIDHLYPV